MNDRALDKDLDLGRSVLGRDYVASTVVHRRFTVDLLRGSEVSDSAAALLDAYAELLESGELEALNQDVAPETATTIPTPEAPVSPAREDVSAAARAFSEAVETSGRSGVLGVVTDELALVATRLAPE